MFATDSLLDRPASEAIAQLLEAQLDVARACVAKLKHGEDPEALHDFRVALRRFRSIASMFPEYGRRLVGRKRLKALKRLARGTNEARDAEVRLHWIEGNEAIIPDDADFHTGYVTLHDAFAAEYQELAAALRKPLRRRFKQLRERMLSRMKKARRMESPRFGELLATASEALTEAFRDQLSRLRGERDGAAVHRARILAKRMRYLLEPVTGEVGAAARAVGLLKDLQTELGDLHDALLRKEEMLETSRRTGSLIYHGLMVEILEHGQALQDLDTRIIRPSLKGVLCIADHLREQVEAGFEQLARKLDADYVERLLGELEQVPVELRALLPPDPGADADPPPPQPETAATPEPMQAA